MKPIVYFISGLAADHRAYINIDLEGYESKHLAWIEPFKNEKLSNYANRMIENIDLSKPVILIGTSLGGIIAVEISKIIKVEKVVLISTIKSAEEQPYYFIFWRIFPLYKLIPDWLLANARFWVSLLFSYKIKKKWKELFIDMFNRMPKGMLIWAFEVILNWENETLPKNYLHIHGGRDFVFPYKFVKEARLIQNGTHIMVVTKGREISKLINEYLKF